MRLTHKQVKAMMRDYSMIKIALARYERERRTLIAKGGGSLVQIPGKGHSPVDSVLNKVSALEALDARYAEVLRFVECVDDVVRCLPRATANAFRAYFFEGRSMRDAAAKVGVATSTLARRIDHALDVLTTFLNTTA